MSTDGLGGDPGRFPARFLPREPGVYTPSNHFQSRARDDTRVVSTEMAERAIRGGLVEEDSHGKWRFVNPEPGLECHVACAVSNERRLVVVTGWTTVEDAETAIIDGGFDRHAVKSSAFRDIVCTEGPFAPEIRDVSFNPPVEVYEHLLYTESGENRVRCERCGGSFTRRGTLKLEPCEA